MCRKSASRRQEMVTVDRDLQREEYSYYSMEEPVNLVWHQVTNTDANGGLGDTLANVDRSQCDLANLVQHT